VLRTITGLTFGKKDVNVWDGSSGFTTMKNLSLRDFVISFSKMHLFFFFYDMVLVVVLLCWFYCSFAQTTVYDFTQGSIPFGVSLYCGPSFPSCNTATSAQWSFTAAGVTLTTLGNGFSLSMMTFSK
jgi:hypothetical protein